MTPPTEDTATPPPTDAAENLLDTAEQAGALKPVELVLQAEGAELSARDCMKYAQFDDRTKEKTPDELAAMIAEDPSLIADIAAEKAKAEGSEAPGGPSAEDMMSERMGKARQAETDAAEAE